MQALSGQRPGTVAPEPAADLEEVLGSAVALLQGLDDAARAPRSGLWFVTRGGQVITDEVSGILIGSALWGLGRVAARELPEVGVRMLDLDPGADPDVTQLARELLFPDGETEVAWRAGKRLVSRVVRPPVRGSRTAPARHLPKDRTVLVTGAFGGIGGAVARWLAAEGFAGIVLNGRRPQPELAGNLAAALRAQGAAVRVEYADVADRPAVQRMLENVDSSGLPPLGGVIHCAGSLSDGSLTNQDWGSFERVFRPKALGAWNLHQATLDRDLDLFVLFSSVSATIGNPGQANYAAANAFVEQLARQRRALGFNGQAIAWGAWSGLGMAEARREQLTARMTATGLRWLTPEQGLNALSRVLDENVGTSVVGSFDWTVLGRCGFAAPVG